MKAKSQVIAESLHDIRRAVETIDDALVDLRDVAVTNQITADLMRYFDDDTLDTLESLTASILDIVNAGTGKGES